MPGPGFARARGRRASTTAGAVQAVKLPRIPPPLGALVSAFPQYPHSALLAGFLSLFARRLFAADETARLEGKVIRVCVRDAGLRLTLRIGRGGYTACHGSVIADATIGADARELVLVALGSADPDTLFFDRRLTIAGDTEVGLLVKNALDRIAPPLPAPLLQHLRSSLS